MAVPATVVHVITQLELGGAQEITLFTCRHLDRSRYRVHLIAGEGGLLDEEARAIPDLELRFEPLLVREVRPAIDLRCLRSLAAALREIRRRTAGPVIVHTHSSKAGILGRWAAWSAGAGIIVHSIHGFGFHDRQPWPVRRAFQAAERVTAPITHAFCPVSEANRQVAERLGLLHGGKPAVILPSGIDRAEYEPKPGERERFRAEVGLPPAAPVVGMIACLKPQKRPVDFVEVATRLTRKHPEAHFFIAGDGVLRGAIEEAVRHHGLDGRFHLLGWRRDVRSALAAADVLVLTSAWEGLPRVTLQAMAARRPMVATNVDGTPESVVEGRTGFLLEPGDVDGFADRIGRLLADPALAYRMGEAARERLGEFEAGTMLRRLESLYDDLVAGRRPAPAPVQGARFGPHPEEPGPLP